MPAEFIDLISSSPVPKPAEIKPISSKTTSSAKTSAPKNADYFDISSDIEEQLPTLPSVKLSSKPTKPKQNTTTTTAPQEDWLQDLSSVPDYPAKSNITAKRAARSAKRASSGKGVHDALFLSDDFDSTVNLDDSIALDRPSAKRRRVSSSPQPELPKSTMPRTAGYQRSKSDITGNTNGEIGRRVADAALKRAASSSKALELDPLVFTSSPDPFADAARRRKERLKLSRPADSDDADIYDLDPPVSKAGKKSSILQTSYGSNSASFDNIPELSEDYLSDLGERPTGKSSKASTKSSKAVLAKYNADRAKGKKEQEKQEKQEKQEEKQKSKGNAAAKLAEKESRREAKEGKVKEKQKAVELAKVNTLRIDKKVSTPEMIVDLPSSLDPRIAGPARTYLTGLQVEHFEWESSLPIVKWRRKVIAEFNEELGHYEPIAPYIKKEKHVMYIMTAEEFVNLALEEDEDDLDAYILKLKSKYQSSEIIFLIQGYVTWLRKNRNIKNRQFTQAVRGQINQTGHDEPPPTASQKRKKKKEPEYVDQDRIEDAMLRLQVAHGALIHHTNVINETAEWIAIFTQHISTIPYRSQRESHDTAFCMESGQVKAGDGASDTYTKMLQEIVRLTAPIAYGIAADYPTLRKLVEGLEEEGPLVLQDCRKSANRDGAFTDRRVGPAISKRVHKVFLGRDPGSADV